MKIAIIGCGYVGKAAAQAWQAQGDDVTLITRSQSRIKELSALTNNVKVVEPRQFKEAIRGQEAILLSVAPDRPDQYVETYLGSAAALLRDLDESTSQILYTSSSSVYGEQGGLSWMKRPHASL